MPTGVLLVAERTITLAGTIEPNPQRVLDIGCGYGKHGVLLREYLDPTPVVHGVEAWQPYIENHRLRGIYDYLHECDARTLTAVDLLSYDLVIMGDVIEHFEKQEGLDFIDRVSGWMVIATPAVHFHTDPHLPPTERHLSHWTPDDFEATGRLDHVEIKYGAVIARLKPRT
jgi:2-polyprenyl-3-methyl-5-hydroxy-6-metoxy-1,4-benzoquinol methylase